MRVCQQENPPSGYQSKAPRLLPPRGLYATARHYALSLSDGSFSVVELLCMGVFESSMFRLTKAGDQIHQIGKVL